MSSCFAVPLDVQSDVRDLHSAVGMRARASLAYFVRSVLGLRRLKTERLDALQSGGASPSEFEGKLLSRWAAYRETGEFLS